MEMARIEDVFEVKGHLVLAAVLLPGTPGGRAEIREALGTSITIRTPDGRELVAPLLDLNVHESVRGQMQLMAGIDPPPGSEGIPAGSLIISGG